MAIAHASNAGRMDFDHVLNAAIFSATQTALLTRKS
jgi:hypothetical protein